MSETYCGKICGECSQREMLNCPGCRQGPGRAIGGDCELAKCCRDRGHESCATCVSRGHCGTYISRDTAPRDRIRKQMQEKEAAEELARRAPFLGKWMWLLFWLVIAQLPVGLLSSVGELAGLSGMNLLGQLLSAAFTIGYALILLKLSQEEEGFRSAGWCMLAVGVINLVLELIFGIGQVPLLASIPLAIVSLVGQFHEFHAFGDSLSGVDRKMSEKWYRLWSWYIGSYGVMLGSILVMLLSILLGALVMLAAGIALIVLSIMRIIYLYKSAQIFRVI